MRIYVASSWRNPLQPAVVDLLKNEGHEVYDFRHPLPGEHGFGWSQIDPEWKRWSSAQFRAQLQHPIAQRGFRRDRDALDRCDACVLVLPCGRSAHLELGWAAGRGKRTLVLASSAQEPELMYLLCDKLCIDVAEVLDQLRAWGEVPDAG